VINDLLVRGRAMVGLVDEDPHGTHHRLRDGMAVVSDDVDVQVRRANDRSLIIVKPELEECFLRGMKRVDVESRLPTKAPDLRRLLSIPASQHAIHRRFREELRLLHSASRARKMATFITAVEDVLR